MGQYARIQSLDLQLEVFEHFGRILAFAHQHEACNNVILLVLAGESLPRYAARLNGADVSDQQRRTGSLSDNDVTDVVCRFQKANPSNQVLLLAPVDITSAGIGAAATQSGKQLLQRDAIGFQLRKIRLHLVLLDEAAIGHHVRNTGHRFQLPRDDPVLDRTHVCRREAAFEPIAINLTDRSRQRSQLWVESRREVDVAQSLQHLLSREVRVNRIVESHRDE